MKKYDNLLEVESRFYSRKRDELLLKYPNRVLLIHEENVAGDFSTEHAAIAEGVRRFGSGPFLVRKTGEDEPTLSAPALVLGILQCP